MITMILDRPFSLVCVCVCVCVVCVCVCVSVIIMCVCDMGNVLSSDPNTLCIEVSSSAVTIPTGGNRDITCRVTCTCMGAMVSWTRADGSQFPSSVREVAPATRRRSILRVTGATSGVAGVYTCTGTYEDQTQSKMTTITITS